MQVDSNSMESNPGGLDSLLDRVMASKPYLIVDVSVVVLRRCITYLHDLPTWEHLQHDVTCQSWEMLDYHTTQLRAIMAEFALARLEHFQGDARLGPRRNNSQERRDGVKVVRQVSGGVSHGGTRRPMGKLGAAASISRPPEPPLRKEKGQIPMVPEVKPMDERPHRSNGNDAMQRVIPLRAAEKKTPVAIPTMPELQSFNYECVCIADYDRCECRIREWLGLPNKCAAPTPPVTPATPAQLSPANAAAPCVVVGEVSNSSGTPVAPDLPSGSMALAPIDNREGLGHDVPGGTTLPWRPFHPNASSALHGEASKTSSNAVAVPTHYYVHRTIHTPEIPTELIPTQCIDLPCHNLPRRSGPPRATAINQGKLVNVESPRSGAVSTSTLQADLLQF